MNERYSNFPGFIDIIISFMNSLKGPAEISEDIKMLFDTFRAIVMTPTPYLAVGMCERRGEKETQNLSVDYLQY